MLHPSNLECQIYDTGQCLLVAHDLLMRNGWSIMPISNWKTTLADYKYYALGGIYVLAMASFFSRVRRQPYSQSMKVEQYESIFKAATLSTVLVGVGIHSGFDRYWSRDGHSNEVDRNRR